MCSRTDDPSQHEDRNPEYPDRFPTESEVIARVAAAQPATEPRRRLTDWERDEIAAEIELDMI